MNTKTLRALIAALMTVATSVTARAQITTGTVSGTVEDAQGGRIPGATVTLISESRGTRSSPAVTDSDGTYVLPNVSPDRYTIEVVMDGFRTLVRKGVDVSSGDRVSIPPFVLEVGGQTESVSVVADTPLVQAHSAERSFTVATTEVENLPLSNRNFASLAALAPGVSGTQRVGGGGQSNFTMDGVSIVDTGNNGQMLQMNVDAIGEVKILTSNYQAEYGRSSGLQITAVTKSGTNRFRGSIYDVIRDSDWNENSWANVQNGLPKPVMKQSDWGYTVGGPVGKPGANNNLFFFYSHEYRPREGGGTVSRFRFPTALERSGDFSQTRDNTGNVFNLIRDSTSGLPCTPSDTRGCFQDGGVVGRIPQSRLYAPGMAILNNLWPMPNVNQQAGMNYNYEVLTPVTKSLTYQPAVRIDYQPTTHLRVTGRFSGQNSAAGRPLTPGSLPGYNDTQRIPDTEWITSWAFTGNYSLSPTMFLEGTYGRSRNYLTNVLMTEVSNVNNTGLASLPLLYPDGRIVDPEFFAFEALSKSKSPYFADGRIWLPPNFAWGTRIGCPTTNNGGVAAPCPPNLQFPGALNTNITQDVSINLTKVAGRHTFKTGFYWNNSLKAQNINLALGALPFNSLMNFSNGRYR